MALDSQPTKSVPRRVRLVIERNIDEMCPKRNPQSRMQHENLDVRSVGTTRPLRGVALFDETCDLTDEDAQEATVRACWSVNPGIIIVGIPRTASKSHFEFCMTLCTWQHERGALYIMILERFRGYTFRGTVFDARNAAPKRGECTARTGSPTSGDRDQVGLQPFCHESRSRVDHFIHDGRAYPTRSDQRRTVRPQDDDATWPTRTMDADQRSKNDEHPEAKGGETKLLRRRRPGRRNLFDCVGRGKHVAWIILPQSTERRRGILETPFCPGANAVFESNRNRMARSTRFQGSDLHRFHASGCDQRKTQ